MADVPFSTLPGELIVEILSNLACSDLASCRRINRHLKDIIDSSEQLQHHIDIAIAGVMDNPKSSMSLRERREALVRRQKAWDTCQPQSTAEVDERNPGLWLRLDPLREEGYHQIIQLSVPPDNGDIVAVGMR
jgi:hypothetical protein